MGALPKRKISKARKGERRANLHLDPVQLVECPHCHEPRLSHTVCPKCGWYKGVEVVKPQAPKEKQKTPG